MLAFPVEMSPTIAGLAKAYYAFGGSVFACIASAYFYDAEKAYILFIALTVPVIIPLLGQMLNLLPNEVLTDMEYEEKHDIDPSLSLNFYHAIALFFCILLYVILRLSNVGHAVLGVFATVVVVCAVSILLIPLIKRSFYIYIPIATEDSNTVIEMTESVSSPLGHESHLEMSETHLKDARELLSEREAELVMLGHHDNDTGSDRSRPSDVEPTKDLTVCGDMIETVVVAVMWILLYICLFCLLCVFALQSLEMVMTLRFWVVFSIQACGFGGVLVVVNLINSIADAYGISDAAVYIAILGLSSAVARAMFGYISKAIADRMTLVGMMGRINLILSVNSLVFAFTTGSPALFGLLVSVTGFCYGSIAVLAAAVNVDMFGVKYIATNDGIFDFSNAVGSLVFVFVLVSLFPVDDSELAEDADDDDALGCSGAKCFQNVFFGASALCFVAFLMSIPLNLWLLRKRKLAPNLY
jgi:MFS family permease